MLSHEEAFIERKEILDSLLKRASTLQSEIRVRQLELRTVDSALKIYTHPVEEKEKP